MISMNTCPYVPLWYSTAAAEQSQGLNLQNFEIPNLGSTLKLLINVVMVDSPFHIHFTHVMFKSNLSNLKQEGRELVTVKQLPY